MELRRERKMKKVYIVIIHYKNKNGGFFQLIETVFSTREKAETFCSNWNKRNQNVNQWMDFISEIVDERESEVVI
jgi:hypothetical protein